MTKTLKTLFFFICYHPFPRQPVENVRSFGPEGWGYSEGGQIKTNFSLFSFVCVCVCVCVLVWSISGAWSIIVGGVFWKSVGIPVFLLTQCKSGSLYFPHKLLNETVYLRSMKSPRVGITAFLCALRWGIDRQWDIDGRKKPFRGRSCILCKEFCNTRFYSGNDVPQKH